jgi:hypothetical protein
LEKKHGLLHDQQMAPQWSLQERWTQLHLIIVPELKEKSIRTQLSVSEKNSTTASETGSRNTI